LQPYFTDAVKILVTDGYLNTDGKFNLDMGQASGPDVKFDGQASITNFICLDKHTAKDFFKCNSFYLSGLGVSLFPMDLAIKEVSLTDFYSRIIVDDSGELNLNTIFRKDDGQGKNLDGSGDTGQNKDETPGKYT
jgi:hypothetical protein